MSDDYFAEITDRLDAYRKPHWPKPWAEPEDPPMPAPETVKEIWKAVQALDLSDGVETMVFLEACGFPPHEEDHFVPLLAHAGLVKDITPEEYAESEDDAPLIIVLDERRLLAEGWVPLAEGLTPEPGLLDVCSVEDREAAQAYVARIHDSDGKATWFWVEWDGEEFMPLTFTPTHWRAAA